MNEQQPKRSRRLTVSERNLQKAASRLFPQNPKLVSTEVEYLKRHLGNTATQDDMDQEILRVRKMPWASLLED